MVDHYIVGFMMIMHHEKLLKYIDSMKWIGTISQVIATIILISPTIAATSTAPWILYIIGAVIWLIDGLIHKNKQLVWLSIFFILWDTLTILSRILNIELLEYLKPITAIFERFI